MIAKSGQPADVQHASVDTRVAPRGKLVIWLMGHNEQLFDRINSYGLHAIRVHYANRWFSICCRENPVGKHCRGNIRRLITDFDVQGDDRRAHSLVVPGSRARKDSTTAEFLHEDVWRYLFTEPVERVGSAVPMDNSCNKSQRP